MKRSLRVVFIIALLVCISMPEGLAGGKPVKAGAYGILSALNTNKAIDVNGCSCQNGAKMQIWDKNYSGAQLFYLEYNNGYYIIKNINSGKVLDVKGGRAGNGIPVTQWQPNGGRNQLWELVSAGGGYYYIKSALGNYYLDVTKGRTNNGTQLIIYSAQRSTNQKFCFESLRVKMSTPSGKKSTSGRSSVGRATVHLADSGKNGKVTLSTKDVGGWKTNCQVHVVMRDTSQRWIREFDTTTSAVLTLGTDYLEYTIEFSPKSTGSSASSFINRGKWASWEIVCDGSNCWIE